MSYRLFNLARELSGLSSSEKFVLLMLCDRADEEGRCWPSLTVLMRDTLLSERTVQAAIASLVGKGFVSVERQSGIRNHYRILHRNMSDTPAIAAPPQSSHPRNSCGGPPQPLPPTPAIDDTLHYGEPPVNHQEPPSFVVASKNNANDLFESTPSVLQSNKIPPCPHQEIIALFHEILPELPEPKAEHWNGVRAKHLCARWKWVLTEKHRSGAKAGKRFASNEQEGIDFFRRFFGYVKKVDFLMGREKDWRADIGWLLRPSNFAKVVEGNYERGNERGNER